ncbi:MAG: BlaI/MecI/CopY family transcriptional regulator [Maribacter sp.]
MKKLTEREDQIMQIVWNSEGVFIRDIVEQLPNPKPHYNSVATIVKILVKKGFLSSVKLGNTDRYSAKISMNSYRKEDMKDIKKKYFGNSLPQMMAHFAKEEKLSDTEIKELIEIIKSKKG